MHLLGHTERMLVMRGDGGGAAVLVDDRAAARMFSWLGSMFDWVYI